MRTDGFWITVGLTVMGSTLPWNAAGGGEWGLTLIVLAGATIVFRAVARHVGDPFVPRLPLRHWTLLALAAAWVVGAVRLSPFER